MSNLVELKERLTKLEAGLFSYLARPRFLNENQFFRKAKKVQIPTSGGYDIYEYRNIPIGKDKKVVVEIRKGGEPDDVAYMLYSDQYEKLYLKGY